MDSNVSCVTHTLAQEQFIGKHDTTEEQCCLVIHLYHHVHNYASSQTKVSIGIWSIRYREANKVFRHCIENSASVWIFGLVAY